MFKNYFKVGLRNIMRTRFLSSLNILGLSIGLCAALVIYLIVQYQLSFDKHYKDGDRIYRVVTHLRFAETDFKNSGVPAPLASATKLEMTGLEKSSAILSILYSPKVSVVRAGNTARVEFKKQDRISFADEDFFSIFEKQILAGTIKGMNEIPGQVVLSRARAGLYFPNRPLDQVPGSVIYYNDTIQGSVAAVMEDNKYQTDLVQDEIISLPTIKTAGLSEHANLNEWGSVNSNSELYIRVAKNSDPSNIQQQFRALMLKYKKPEPGVDQSKNFSKLILQPLSAIHFSQEYGGAADRKTLNGLAILAAFLLLLGCINFINLSTAQATRRAKEIGIRKTVGSSRGQLIGQFLSETFILTIISTILAIILSPFLLEVFSDFIPAGLKFDNTAWRNVLVFAPVLIIVVSVIAGFYPAIVLSRFKPVLVLKNQSAANTGESRSAWLRKTLTVSQFVIAQFFVIATIVVGRQIHHSINMDMGFTKDNIVSFNVPFDFYKPDSKILVLRNQIRDLPGIQQIALGDRPAISGSMSNTYKLNVGGKEKEVNIQTRNGDSAFVQVFNIKILAGRNLRSTDTGTAMLINEEFAKEMGYNNPAEAVGRYISEENKIQVAGVMKNFNLTSARSGILPMALRSTPQYYREMHIALQPELHNGKKGSGSQKQTLAAIEKQFKAVYPEGDFNYTYYDQVIEDFYGRERQLAKMLNWSTGLSVFISCLGLLGLVIYTANQRQKEIGIRKVLGASVTQVVNLLSKDFLKLVAVACIVAIPVAWWACNNWLQDFPYRAPLNAWIFFAGAGSLLIIAFLVLSFKTIQSASANPVKSLRSE